MINALFFKVFYVLWRWQAMGGVPHTCLDFGLFDKVNKLDNSSLLSLYVLRKKHWA